MRPWAALVVAISLFGSLGSTGYAQNTPIESQKVSISGPPEETLLKPTCKGLSGSTGYAKPVTIADDGSVFTFEEKSVPVEGRAYGSRRVVSVSKNCDAKGKTWKSDLSFRAPEGIQGVTDSGGALYYTATGYGASQSRTVVGKLSSSGSRAWETDIDPRWQVHSETIIALPPGGKVVYVSARSGGQLPRHPVEARLNRPGNSGDSIT